VSLYDRFNLLRSGLSPRAQPPALVGYGAAVLLVGLSTLVGLWFRPATYHSPYLFFYAAILISLLYGGFGAGLASTFLSALLVNLLFQPPYGQFSHDLPDLARGSYFCLSFGFICWLVDTRRRRAEGQIQTQHQLLDMAAAPVIMCDEDDRITYWNKGAESVYGWNEEEAIGQHLTELLHTVLPEPIQDIKRQLTSVGQWSGELKRTRKDGSAAFVSSSWTLRRTGRHGLTRLESDHDLTEQHLLEEQFLQAQKMEAVGRLSDGVAHDFNNILMVITGYGDLLKEQLASDERLRRMIDEILKAANRAASLTHQLLAFSRKQILMPKVVDLNNVLADLGKMLPRLIGEDIDLEIVPGNGLGRVMADASQMQQVVMNLVVNARDAMPDGGRLTIETANAKWDEKSGREYGIGAKPGSFVLLTVADNGIGMDQEIRAHLFEPFFTTKDVNKGTGLGLSIVYGVVKQSGGFIWVDSEPGRGTTFKIYLPRIEAEEANTSAINVPPKRRRGSETILLVEDEQSVREAISHFLRAQGYTVLEAHNASVAIEIAQEQSKQIHLLMTDMIMPKMNGRELAKQLTATRPEMRVLYISGYTDRGLGGGTTIDSTMNFLQKPFDFDVLGHKLRDMLER
jgi:two-component system cell cycle sensor histidine kinase/response regulator CckA